jgi:autotransporter-associated beta strand protein
VQGTTITLSQPVTQAHSGTGIGYQPGARITLGSGGLIMNGSAGAITINPMLSTGGELVLFMQNTANFNVINGVISATGLTKFGTGDVRVSSDNRGTLTGDTVLSGYNWFRLGNLYALGGDVTNPYNSTNKAILNMGQLYSENANQIYLYDVVVNSESQMGGNTSAYRSLTINGLANNPNNTPTAFNIPNAGQLYFSGLTTFNAPTALRTDQLVILQGGLSGSGSLQKYGGSWLQINGNSTGYTGAEVQVNQGTLFVSNGVVSQRPLGNANVTVNPGAVLRLAGDNLGGSLTLNSDTTGLAVLGLNYNPGPSGALPAATFSANGGASAGTLAVDVVGFSRPINLSTLGNGTVYLGSFGNGTYSASSLTPSSGVYRLGTGGGTLQMTSPVLTGATNRVQIGMLSGDVQAQSADVTNQGGTVAINNANTFGGGMVVARNITARFGAAGAFGTGPIIFNGGFVDIDGNFARSRAVQPPIIPNPVTLRGDAGFAGASDVTFSGALALAPTASVSGGSVTRTLTFNNTTGLTFLSGGVSLGGADSAFLIKAGAGPVVFSGAQVPGMLRLDAGAAVINGDANFPVDGAIVFNAGTVAVPNAVSAQPLYRHSLAGITVAPVVTTNRDYLFQGAGTFDVGAGIALVQGTGVMNGSGILNKNGAGVLVLNGAANAMAQVQVNAGALSASNNAQLGDTTANSALLITNSAAFYANGSFASPRAINSTTNLSGTIDVAAGQTFTSTGVISLGTGLFTKAGPGTMVALGTNTQTTLAISGGGTFASYVAQPFATTATITLNGGALRLMANLGAQQTNVQATTLTLNGAGVVQVEDSPFTQTRLTLTNLNRANYGTLVLNGVNGRMGVGLTSGGEIVIPTNIFGVAAASAPVAGVGALPASILVTGGTSPVASFSSVNVSNNVINRYAGATLSGFGGATSTSIVDVSAPQTISGSASAFGVRTSADVMGGTLSIDSSTNLRMGGLIINGAGSAAPVIGSNLVFAQAGQAGTVMPEALVYVSGGYTSGTATVSGDVTSGVLTKFGPGDLYLSGRLGVVSVLAQQGAVRFAPGATIYPLNTAVVANDTGTVDVNGRTVAVATLNNSTNAAGGFVTNSAVGAGTFTLVGTGNWCGEERDGDIDALRSERE